SGSGAWGSAIDTSSSASRRDRSRRPKPRTHTKSNHANGRARGNVMARPAPVARSAIVTGNGIGPRREPRITVVIARRQRAEDQGAKREANTRATVREGLFGHHPVARCSLGRVVPTPNRGGR